MQLDPLYVTVVEPHRRTFGQERREIVGGDRVLVGEACSTGQFRAGGHGLAPIVDTHLGDNSALPRPPVTAPPDARSLERVD
ncbi:hypothetical protein D3C72_2340990 [compost metagenome]